MKKNLLIVLSFIAVILSGCMESDSNIEKINPEDRISENGESIEKSFNKQIENSQYIRDINDFISYDILSTTENKPYNSEFSITADFDKKSTIQGGLEFSQNKITRSDDLGSSDVEFNVELENYGNNSEPFDLSGNLSLLYQNDEMYVNIHKFGVYMGEGNMTAKLYTLLSDLVIDKRVDMQVHDGGIVSVSDEDDGKFQHIVGNIKDILKTEEIYDNPSFIGSVSEFVNLVNSYIDLGISTNDLQILSGDVLYSEISDDNIQKDFIGIFQSNSSVFILSFTASKNGVEINISDIKDYDENSSNFSNIESSLSFSIQENKKSVYDINLQATKSQTRVADINGKIKYADRVDFSADFGLKPLEILAGNYISGNLKGYISKKTGEGNNKFHELTGDIVLFNEIMSSIY